MNINRCLYVVLSLTITYSVIDAVTTIPVLDNWDRVFSYRFDYERVMNDTNTVIRRVSFSTAAHIRYDPEDVNSVLVYFEQPFYEHDDQYHRNRNFIDKIEGIELPFRIKYYWTGLAHEICTDPDDTDFSARFKKTFASLVQIDWSKILERTSWKEFDYQFLSPEMTMFGDCDVMYNVTQIGEGRIVTKRIIVETCMPDKEYSQNLIETEFKFKSSRDKDFHMVKLVGVEYVPESDSYSKLEQQIDFVENVRSVRLIHSNRLTVNRVLKL